MLLLLPGTMVKVCIDSDLLAASSYPVPGGKVCWITQLVVHKDQRNRGIASFLLKQLRRPELTAFGLVSSHPAACLALSRLGGWFFIQSSIFLPFSLSVNSDCFAELEHQVHSGQYPSYTQFHPR